MSYATALRQHIENLLLGSAGTTRTMVSGRFHLRAPDSAEDRQPVVAAERAVEVVISPPTPHDAINGLDGFALYNHAVTIRIYYALTNAGGDLAETVTEQDGPGTWDAVRDRAGTDTHDVAVVLTWHENHAGTDPTIINLAPASSGPSGPVLRGNEAVLELPYAMIVYATVPGAYAP